MARDEASEKFLRDGIFRYAEARATVLAFEEAVEEKVVQVAAGATSRLVGRGGKGTIEGRGVCNGDAGGRVAYAHFRGVFGGEAVTWELGVWWEHPADGDSVTVYAECWKGPSELTQKPWAKLPDDPAHTWTAYKGGLSLALRSDDELDAAFTRLVGEVAKQSAEEDR